MDSLWDALLSARRSELHCWTGDGFAVNGWDEVVADAHRMAAGLRDLGVRPGVPVATILTNTPLAVRGTLAIWLAGGVLASLPVPARGMSEAEYMQQIRGICRAVGSPVLLTDGALLGLFPDEAIAETGCTAWEAVRSGSPLEPLLPGEDEPAFIQYSSGSTGSPKGCVLTPRAIAAQLSMILEMSDGDPGRERVVSWLPLSHDMGMFGCLLFPWAHDMPLALSTPERFMFGGRTWFADLADFGGTMTAGTNTALYLAARGQRGRRLSKPLVLRTAIIGAERVDRTALLQTVEAFGDSGMTLGMCMPAYGMAEATLAVTAAHPTDDPRFLAVDGIDLADGRVVPADPADPAATWLVGCGTPCPGVTVTVTDPGSVSELVVRSPSLSTGYFGDPELTRSRFTPDGFRTGDVGFERDGELYLVGRLDDVISVGGRNVNTRDIEIAVDALEPLHHGSTAILDLGAGPRGRLVLVTELRKRDADVGVVADAAARIAMARAGIALDECVFLTRGTLPKTPSGKIQRYRARQLLLTGDLKEIATVKLDA